MTKILVMSDIHLEFKPLDFQLPAETEIVILAGDIDHGSEAIAFARREFPENMPVIAIAGNHEFYGSSIEVTFRGLREAAAKTNVKFLEADEVLVPVGSKVIRFLGAMLWTDFQLRGVTHQHGDMAYAARAMNDFRLIKFRGRRLTPEDTVQFHCEAREWLEKKLEEEHKGPTVVVTHHSPSGQSEHPRYAGGELTAAFHSNLEPLIERFQPELWVHGHSHHSVDYHIGRTRIVSNQRGYPGERCGFRLATIDL